MFHGSWSYSLYDIGTSFYYHKFYSLWNSCTYYIGEYSMCIFQTSMSNFGGILRIQNHSGFNSPIGFVWPLYFKWDLWREITDYLTTEMGPFYLKLTWQCKNQSFEDVSPIENGVLNQPVMLVWGCKWSRGARYCSYWAQHQLPESFGIRIDIWTFRTTVTVSFMRWVAACSGWQAGRVGDKKRGEKMASEKWTNFNHYPLS